MLKPTQAFFAVDGLDESIFIHVNNFDYDALLNKMVAKLDLGDSYITSEIVLKTFKTLAAKFNNNRRGELTPDELALVETFIARYSGYRFADYDGESSSEFYESMGDLMNHAFEEFSESLTTDQDDLNEEAKEFNELLFRLIDAADGELAIETLMELVDKYLSENFNDLELTIMKEMEGMLNEGEIITGIEVVEKAGKVIKYGDTLITFPIVLMKATES